MQTHASASTTDTEPLRLIRKRAVLSRVPWSETTLWRAVRAGRFPAPVRLGVNSVAWREADVNAWIAERERA
jgi:prophage regulatory protein